VFSEELAGIFIHTEERYRLQQVAQSPLTLLGIAGVVHTLVEFRSETTESASPWALSARSRRAIAGCQLRKCTAQSVSTRCVLIDGARGA